MTACQCPIAGFCDRYHRNMVGRLHQICSGQAAGVSPEKCEAYRAKWDREATPIKALLADNATKVFLADLAAIGGKPECTAREVAKLGITGDPGITLAELHKTHPEIAVRAAKWIAKGKPMPGNDQKPTGALAKVSALEKELQKWEAAGKPLTTADELAARLAICPPCESFKDGKCAACGGCGLKQAPFLARAYGILTGRGDVPGKAEMRTATCPKKKWPELTMAVPAQAH